MAKRDGFFGDTVSVAIGWVIGMALVVLFLLAITSAEDDPFFNCYVSGNMTCGSGTPWHGFVNEFQHADR